MILDSTVRTFWDLFPLVQSRRECRWLFFSLLRLAFYLFIELYLVQYTPLECTHLYEKSCGNRIINCWVARQLVRPKVRQTAGSRYAEECCWFVTLQLIYRTSSITSGFRTCSTEICISLLSIIHFGNGSVSSFQTLIPPPYLLQQDEVRSSDCASGYRITGSWVHVTFVCQDPQPYQQEWCDFFIYGTGEAQTTFKAGGAQD
jgi:hypothetical protein